jgi:hypothetical protein
MNRAQDIIDLLLAAAYPMPRRYMISPRLPVYRLKRRLLREVMVELRRTTRSREKTGPPTGGAEAGWPRQARQARHEVWTTWILVR